MSCEIPDGTRQQLLEGTWDATSQLLAAGEAIETKMGALPYPRGFEG
jgi:hypothetical protein